MPDTPHSKDQLIRELRDIERSLNVDETLKMYGASLEVTRLRAMKDAHYFLLELLPSRGEIGVDQFKGAQLAQATDEYLKAERALEGPGDQAVLVSVDSLQLLRRAYPNFFLDTQLFLRVVREELP